MDGFLTSHHLTRNDHNAGVIASAKSSELQMPALAVKSPTLHSAMVSIAGVEKLAVDLPDSQRTVLAAHLLRSLPSVLHDGDED